MSDEFPDDINGDVLRRMKTEGDNLAVARDIDFTVIFPNQRAAEQFASTFKERGFRVKVKKSDVDPDRPFDVLVVNHMLPTHAGITAFEEELQVGADHFDGRNDGWGSFNQK